VFAVQDGATTSNNADFDFIHETSYPYINHPHPATNAVAMVPEYDCTEGQAFTLDLTNSGGTAPFKWSAVGLPNGLAINGDTGQISGTLSSSGNITSQFTVKDGNSFSHTRTIKFVINGSSPGKL